MLSENIQDHEKVYVRSSNALCWHSLYCEPNLEFLAVHYSSRASFIESVSLHLKKRSHIFALASNIALQTHI
ncbi:hypothetical protein V3C99_007194 [Haemonchus contortus]